MNKQGLKGFIELKRRQRALYESIEKLQKELDSFDYQETADVVTCGRKRRRAMGRVTVRGYNHRSYTNIKDQLLSKRLELDQIEETIDDLEYDFEEFLAVDLPFDEHEIRMLLMCLLPDFELIRTWEEVASYYKNRHGIEIGADALRIRLQRFLKE